MSMTITNPTGVALTMQNVTVTWNNDKGHLVGTDKSLNLLQAALNTTVFWTGNVNPLQGSYTISTAAAIPTGTSSIVFTFHQSYDTFDGTERILINLATNGCQNTPIDSNPPTPTPTFIPSVTPTNPATPTPPPASVFSNAQFTYNGDGQRVKSVITTDIGTTTTYFVGVHYEVANGVVTKYYYAGAQRIALRSDGTLYFMLGDHLGSTSLVTFANGNVVSETRYREASPRDKAWGEVRHQSGVMPTKYQYTGQYSYQSDFGLLFYNARWYDSYLNHFTQPDTIVPDPSNSLDWNRYSYTRYNPVKYTDPSGHAVTTDTNEAGCNTPGSPKCILDKYSGASTSSQWLQDLELYYSPYAVLCKLGV